MKYELTLYQSIRSGGDGSASAVLMESQELAEWDQEHQDEGWGEECIETIRLQSDSPIEIIDEVETALGYLLELLDYDPEDSIQEFVEQFFPNGIPEITVTQWNAPNNPKVKVLEIWADGKLQKVDWGKQTPEEKKAEIDEALAGLSND